MGKLDEMRRDAGANVGESMGQGRARPEPTFQTSTMPARLQGVTKSKSAAEIPVGKIDRDPNQPRKLFEPEALDRLAVSLKVQGQLQPIRVKWDESAGVYRVMMGERRWRAAMIAGLATLTCIVHEGDLTPAERLSIQVIENALREDLQPIEQARAYKEIMDLNGWSGNQLSKELSVSQTTVVRVLGLLDLAPEVQEHVSAGAISPTVAYEVSRVENPEAQKALAGRIVSENLGRVETMELVRKAGAKTTAPKGRGSAKGPPKPKTYRHPAGTVVVTLKRGGDDATLAATTADMLLAIVEQLRGRGAEQEEAA